MQRGATTAFAGLVALVTGLGCTVDTGAIEVAWVFVDRDGDAIFPGGLFDGASTRDACDLPARGTAGTTSYDLSVELQICDPQCAGGCDDASCSVIAPLGYDCETSRGSNIDIPSSSDPYQFVLKPIIELGSSRCENPDPTCIAAPGPRERTVGQGLTVDLQVYQFIVDVDREAPVNAGGSLDLEACGCEG